MMNQMSCNGDRLLASVIENSVVRFSPEAEDLRIAHAFSIKLNQLSHTNVGSVVSRGFMIHRF